MAIATNAFVSFFSSVTRDALAHLIQCLLLSYLTKLDLKPLSLLNYVINFKICFSTAGFQIYW